MVNIRVFNAGDCAVYQYIKTGKVELVKNNSVIASATPNRTANYNRIIHKITGYLSSYLEGTNKTVIEDDIQVPTEVGY